MHEPLFSTCFVTEASNSLCLVSGTQNTSKRWLLIQDVISQKGRKRVRIHFLATAIQTRRLRYIECDLLVIKNNSRVSVQSLHVQCLSCGHAYFLHGHALFIYFLKCHRRSCGNDWMSDSAAAVFKAPSCSRGSSWRQTSSWRSSLAWDDSTACKTRHIYCSRLHPQNVMITIWDSSWFYLCNRENDPHPTCCQNTVKFSCGLLQRCEIYSS